MADLDEVPYFVPAVTELPRGYCPEGGPLGISNIQPQQLACRTLWLKERLAELALELGEIPDALLRTDNFVVTPTQLSAGQVTLTDSPADPLKVELIIFGGIEQRPGVDFVVTGNVLSWDSLGMELLLDEGTAFTVRYIVS